jgi:tetratricopeptide (TPR) repeat protein
MSEPGGSKTYLSQVRDSVKDTWIMKLKTRLSTKLCLMLLTGFLLGGTAIAQERANAEEDDTKTKQAQAVSKKVYDRIQQAQEKVDAKDYDGALKILADLRDGKLTEYELQNVLNYIGFVHYNMDNIKAAMRVYEDMLKIPSIEPQIKKQTLYTLAQLATMEEDYNKALRLLDQWFVLETNPAPEPYILYAQNLYQVERFADMIKPIETAMQVAVKREKEIKEDWYVLLNFAYFQQENYAKVRDIQKTLLAKWPKKRYWFSLAGAYTELGEDQNLISAYDAAHVQGLLEKESEFVTMAQLYMQAEVPYKAATLLDQKMKEGVVEKNAKNYRLLSQAWQLAMEDEKAIPALQAAANLEEDGELFVRLGNAYLNLGEYDKCEDAVNSGLRKGGLKSPDNAQISLGMCLYNLKKYQAAISAFREAGKSSRSQRIARQWISVIESDIERDEQIRLAEAAARKRTEQLAKRRQQTDRI